MRRKIILWPRFDEDMRLEHLLRVEATTKRAFDKAMITHFNEALAEAEEESPTGNIFLDDINEGGSKAMDKVLDTIKVWPLLEDDTSEVFPPLSGDVREVAEDFLTPKEKEVNHKEEDQVNLDIVFPNWQKEKLAAEEAMREEGKELKTEEAECGGFGDEEREKAAYDFGQIGQDEQDQPFELRTETRSANFDVFDLSNELIRKYRYDDGVIEINNPKTLYISESGSHRVVAKSGWVTYIPPGWRVIQWLPRDPLYPVAF